MKINQFVKFIIFLIIILTGLNSCQEKLTNVRTENIVQIVYENSNVFLITKEDNNNFSTLSIYNKNLDKISSITFQGSFIDSISNNTIFASFNDKDLLLNNVTESIDGYRIIYNKEITPAAKINIIIDSFKINKVNKTIVQYQRLILDSNVNINEYISDNNITEEKLKRINTDTIKLNIFDFNKITFNKNIFKGMFSSIVIFHGKDYLRVDEYFLSKNDFELYKKAVFNLCLNSLNE